MKVLKSLKSTSGTTYSLILHDDGSTTISIPDGEGGWFMLQDDALDMVGDFETHVDNLDEETRILMAEAAEEFGFEVSV